MKESAETIGIRELRQHASRYIAMVKEGKRIAVTERGELVGYLEPVNEPVTTFERMRAAGLVRPASGRWILDDLEPTQPVEPGEKTLAETLQEMRDEERY